MTRPHKGRESGKNPNYVERTDIKMGKRWGGEGKEVQVRVKKIDPTSAKEKGLESATKAFLF
jgi:hypothetical protein